MKKTIAYKKQSAGILYIICTLIFLFILVKMFESNDMTKKEVLFVLLSFSVITVLSLVLSIQFLLLPSELIILVNHQTLILPKGVTVSLESIDEVTFKRASGKGARYRWGSVKLLTYHGTYKIHFVADCEDVAIELNKLVRKAKKMQNAELG